MSQAITELMTCIARLEDLKVWADGRILTYRKALALPCESCEVEDPEIDEPQKPIAGARYRRISREELQQALIDADGHIPTAALALGVSERSLFTRIQEKGVKQHCELDADGRILNSSDKTRYRPMPFVTTTTTA